MSMLPDINPRTLLAMLHDIVAAGLAWALAFWLRLNLELPAPYSAVMDYPPCHRKMERAGIIGDRPY